MHHIHDQQNSKRLLPVQGDTDDVKRFKPSFGSESKRARLNRGRFERIQKGRELKNVLVKEDPNGPLAASDQKQDVWAAIAKSVFSGFSMASKKDASNDLSKFTTVPKIKEERPPAKIFEDDHANFQQMVPLCTSYNGTSNNDDRLAPIVPNFRGEQSMVSSDARLHSSSEVHGRDMRAVHTHLMQRDHFAAKQIPRNHTITASSQLEYQEQEMEYNHEFVVRSHTETHYRVLNQNVEVGYVPDNGDIWSRPAAPQPSNAYSKDIDVEDNSSLVKNPGCSLQSFVGFHNKEGMSTVKPHDNNQNNASQCVKAKTCANSGMQNLTKQELNGMNCRIIFQHLCQEMKKYKKADNFITDLHAVLCHVVDRRLKADYTMDKLPQGSFSGSLKIANYFLVRIGSSTNKGLKQKVFGAAICLMQTMPFEEILKLRDPSPNNKAAFIVEGRNSASVNDPEFIETIVRLKEAIHTTDLNENASPKENWQLIVLESRCSIRPELTITNRQVNNTPSFTASLKLNNYIITQCSDRSRAKAENNCYNSALHILRTKRQSELLHDDTGSQSLHETQNIEMDKIPADSLQHESLDKLKRNLNRVICEVKTTFKPPSISVKLDSILETNYLFPRCDFKHYRSLHSSVVDCSLYANELLLAVGKERCHEEAKGSAYQIAWKLFSDSKTVEDLLVHIQSLNSTVKETVHKTVRKDLKYNNKPDLRKHYENCQVDMSKPLDSIVIVELTEYTKRPFRNALSILKHSATMSRMLMEWESNDTEKGNDTERCVIQIQKKVVADVTCNKDSTPLQVGALTALMKLTNDRPIFRINTAEPKIWIPTYEIETTERILELQENIALRSHIAQINETVDDIRMAHALQTCIEKRLPVSSLEEGYVDVNFAHVIEHIKEFLLERGMCWRYARLRLNNGFQAVVAFMWMCDPERIVKLLKSSRGSVGRYQLISRFEAQKAYQKGLQILSEK